MDRNGQAVRSDTKDFPYELYSKVLEREPVSNVLLLGFPGVGKSTFCNTALSALSPEIRMVAEIGGKNQHTTTQLTAYDVRDYIKNKDVRIRLWDTWGITDKSFNVKFLKELLSGDVPEGYALQQFHAKHSREDGSLPGVPKTAVICFLKLTQAADTELLTQLKITIEELSHERYNPLVIVTWHRGLVGAGLDSALDKIASQLNLPRMNVFALHAYVDHLGKNSSVDNNAFEILYEAVKRSDIFVGQLLREEKRKVREAEEAIQEYFAGQW